MKIYVYESWKAGRPGIFFLSTDWKLLEKRFTQFYKKTRGSTYNIPNMKKWKYSTVIKKIFSEDSLVEWRIIDK